MPTHDHTTDPETDPRVLEEMDEIIAPENDTPV